MAEHELRRRIRDPARLRFGLVRLAPCVHPVYLGLEVGDGVGDSGFAQFAFVAKRLDRCLHRMSAPAIPVALVDLQVEALFVS